MPLRELEGSWEEILEHASELAGRKVHLTVLTEPSTPLTAKPPAFRPGSGRSILRHAGTWAGDDLEACLQDVYANRSKARF